MGQFSYSFWSINAYGINNRPLLRTFFSDIRHFHIDPFHTNTLSVEQIPVHSNNLILRYGSWRSLTLHLSIVNWFRLFYSFCHTFHTSHEIVTFNCFCTIHSLILSHDRNKYYLILQYQTKNLRSFWTRLGLIIDQKANDIETLTLSKKSQMVNQRVRIRIKILGKNTTP